MRTMFLLSLGATIGIAIAVYRSARATVDAPSRS